MVDKVDKIFKNKGETPLECIHNYKKNNPDLKYIPITYAGRLDPLAEGVLLLLIGDECQNKNKYLALPKEYEVDVLFGFATDTYDVMGKIMENFGSPENPFGRSSLACNDVALRAGTREDEGPDRVNWYADFVLKIKSILKDFVGKIKQRYPAFSSRPVQGKPLFMWARESKLNEIEIPSHDVFVESIEIIEEGSVTGEKLLEKIKNDISLVKGDFRQDEILRLWEEQLKNKEKEEYKTVKLKIKCGSGVYVRTLANDIGEALEVPALALDIKRIKVGEYTI